MAPADDDHADKQILEENASLSEVLSFTLREAGDKTITATTTVGGTLWSYRRPICFFGATLATVFLPSVHISKEAAMQARYFQTPAWLEANYSVKSTADIIAELMSYLNIPTLEGMNRAIMQGKSDAGGDDNEEEQHPGSFGGHFALFVAAMSLCSNGLRYAGSPWSTRSTSRSNSLLEPEEDDRVVARSPQPRSRMEQQNGASSVLTPRPARSSSISNMMESMPAAERGTVVLALEQSGQDNDVTSLCSAATKYNAEAVVLSNKKCVQVDFAPGDEEDLVAPKYVGNVRKESRQFMCTTVAVHRPKAGSVGGDTVSDDVSDAAKGQMEQLAAFEHPLNAMYVFARDDESTLNWCDKHVMVVGDQAYGSLAAYCSILLFDRVSKLRRRGK